MLYARVAELADALASGASSSNTVQVQPLSRAPLQYKIRIFRTNTKHTFAL